MTTWVASTTHAFSTAFNTIKGHQKSDVEVVQTEVNDV
jgi:hypothetical protein